MPIEKSPLKPENSFFLTIRRAFCWIVGHRFAVREFENNTCEIVCERCKFEVNFR